MRAQTPPTSLPIFRSAEQARLLARFFLAPSRSWRLDELEDGAVSRATTERELNRLTGAGLVELERVGRTRLWRAGTDSPLFEPLRQLIERTLGVEAQLRQRLAALDGVEAAALFGSWAAGRLRPDSDIDVLVVGDIDFSTLSTRLRPVGELAGRELNLVAFRRDELKARLDQGNRFLQSVIEGPLVSLVGDVRDLLKKSGDR
jgi:predicted nucleotidyltransferase